MRKIFKPEEFTLPAELIIDNGEVRPEAEDLFLLLDYENKEKDLANNYETSIFGDVSFDQTENCAVFNGGYILVNNISFRSDKSFIISLWLYIYEDSSSGYYFIFREKDSKNDYYHSLLRYNDGRFRYALKNNDTQEGFDFYISGANLNTWLNIKIIYDGSNIIDRFKFFVNGEEKNKENIQLNNPFTTVFTINGNLALGNNPDYNINFNGYMKNFRKWDFQIDTDLFSLGKDYTEKIYVSGAFSAKSSVFEEAFLQKWNNFERVGSCDKLRLTDGATEYYHDGTEWREAQEGEYNTAAEIDANISTFDVRSIGIKALIESDGYTATNLGDVTILYDIEPTKIAVDVDTEKAQTINFFYGEKKLLQFAFKNELGETINLEGAVLQMRIAQEIGGEVLLIKDTTDFTLVEDQGLALLYLDTTELPAVGTYYLQIDLIYGSNFLDKSRIFKLKLKQAV